jgi:hypothetical protein
MKPTEKKIYKALIDLLTNEGPMRAGAIGYALWAQPVTACKCENTQATMYCRAAGQLLKRAQEQGLVWCEERGCYRLWHVRELNGDHKCPTGQTKTDDTGGNDLDTGQ